MRCIDMNSIKFNTKRVCNVLISFCLLFLLGGNALAAEIGLNDFVVRRGKELARWLDENLEEESSSLPLGLQGNALKSSE
jgi:hypothetical protein